MSLGSRRRRVLTGRLVVSQCSTLACLVLVAAGARPLSAASPQAPVVRAVESVGMTVADADRSIRFYSTVLSFEKISDVELAGSDYERLEGVFGLRMRVVTMRLGDEFIELTEYLAPQGRPVPGDSHSNDRWFQHIAIITSNMNRAYDWLRENRVQHVSTGPQTLPDYVKSAAGIRAFYFDDPDGHPLEILEFPPDKGDLKWHHANGKLFLGIDHTAIAVANTSASLQFYRDILGFRVAGESENYGPEQEHLNSVFGARLKITTLRSLEGPGIELLEYLAPAGGRAMPEDEHANDVIHHQTRLVTDNIEAALNQMEERHYQLISSGIAAFAKAEIGFHLGMIVRDPDGHAIELVKK
jgi:catechol 2,3-dioxygenase-like lactoylglutathione lyase family enzyme